MLIIGCDLHTRYQQIVSKGGQRFSGLLRPPFGTR